MNSLIQFLFSRPTQEGQHRMRFADLYHSYREFIAEEDIPNVKQNVYDDAPQLIALLTNSLLSALHAVQGDKQVFLLRRYLHSVVELLRRPAYPAHYPCESVTDLLWGVLGYPSPFPVRGLEYVKQNPLTLNPLPSFEVVQSYVGHIFSECVLMSENRHDNFLNGFTLGFYALLLTLQGEEDAQDKVGRYLASSLKLDRLGEDYYDHPANETYSVTY